MKRHASLLVTLVILAAILFPVTVLAAPAVPAPAVQETVPDIFAILDGLRDLAKTGATLTGFALLFAAIQNLGKRYRPDLFPDGSAQKWTLATQTITLITLVVLQLTGRADLVPVIDQSAGLIANILTAVLALGYQFLVARKGHEDVLAGMPGIGFSYSDRTAGTTISIFEDSLLSE